MQVYPDWTYLSNHDEGSALDSQSTVDYDIVYLYNTQLSPLVFIIIEAAES
jgi:hypothetical protein